MKSKAKAIREAINDISDEDLILFADSIYNDTLCNITEYIESIAYDEGMKDDNF